MQPDLLDVPCSLCFLISFVQDTRFNFAWDDCIPGEIANNAYAIIIFFFLWGWGGQTRCIIGRLQSFEWLLTSIPNKANVDRFDCDKVFYSLSLLFISFFTCRVDPAYRQAHGRWRLGKSNIHDEYLCRAEKKKTIIKQRKNVFSTSVRHVKMDCGLQSVVKQSEDQNNL